MCSDLEIGKSFFHLFGMFEYALKANGYCVSSSTSNCFVRGADWDNFFLENHLLLDIEQYDNFLIKDDMKYVLENPPKQQFLDSESKLVWMDKVYPSRGRNSIPDFKKIHLYIRRVRNNLFHGGKFRGHYFESPERSRTLINCCTNILKHVVDSHEGLKSAFEGCNMRS